MRTKDEAKKYIRLFIKTYVKPKLKKIAYSEAKNHSPEFIEIEEIAKILDLAPPLNANTENLKKLEEEIDEILDGLPHEAVKRTPAFFSTYYGTSNKTIRIYEIERRIEEMQEKENNKTNETAYVLQRPWGPTERQMFKPFEKQKAPLVKKDVPPLTNCAGQQR